MRVRRRLEGIRRAAKTQSPAHRGSRESSPANPGRIRLQAEWRVESKGSPGQTLIATNEPAGRASGQAGEAEARGTEGAPHGAAATGSENRFAVWRCRPIAVRRRSPRTPRS